MNITWDETFPEDTQQASLGAADIRSLTQAVRERLAVDHYFLAVEGGDVKIGYHKSGTFIDQTADLLGAAGAIRIFGKTISGKVELFLVMADNTVVQLTSGGKLNAAAIAGVIPIANLATGTPDGTQFIRDDGTLQVPFTLTKLNSLSGSVVGNSTKMDQVGRDIVTTDAGYFFGTTGTLDVTKGAEYSQLQSPYTAVAGNILVIEAIIQFANSQSAFNDGLKIGLYKDNEIVACAVAYNQEGASGAGNGYTTRQVQLCYKIAAADASEHTWKIRLFANNGTAHLNQACDGNGYVGGHNAGNTYCSSLSITELKA